MAHIHTSPGQHDLTASAFIVRTDFDEPKLMLHMHKKLGKWMQFGGHVELHENPWQALTHEILEESGYTMKQLNLIEPYPSPKLSDCATHPLPFSFNTHSFSKDHFHTDVSYAFTTSEKPSQQISDGESADIRPFSLQDLKDLPYNQIFSSVRELSIYVLTDLIIGIKP